MRVLTQALGVRILTRKRASTDSTSVVHLSSNSGRMSWWQCAVMPGGGLPGSHAPTLARNASKERESIARSLKSSAAAPSSVPWQSIVYLKVPHGSWKDPCKASAASITHTT